MDYYDKFLKLGAIKDALQDEESRKLFDWRLDWMVTRDDLKFIERVFSLQKKWHSRYPYRDMLRNDLFNGIVIWGAGHDGRLASKILQLQGIRPDFFCDRDADRTNDEIDGIPVISPEELGGEHTDCLVLIGSRKYGDEIYVKLETMGFNMEHVVKPFEGPLWLYTGWQYFDIFEPGNREIFVDAGACWGDTVIGFAQWAREHCHKIYALEPLEDMQETIYKNFKNEGLHNVEIHNVAAWHKEEALSFKIDKKGKAGSAVGQSGDTVVQGRTIDSIVKDEPVTFIKMDIEGSELMALKGAKKTIMKNRPKLAISIYHKPEDIVDIPLYILELVPEYKLHLRQYTLNMEETVLYAEI